jgi:hypothetical protein
VSFKSKALRLKKGKVSFRLACTSATGTTCKGKAREAQALVPGALSGTGVR